VTPTVAIVGGGLTGIALAHRLKAAGIRFQLFEARDRLGGRIRTERRDTDWFDLGPSWFWPGQPRMAALVERFGLRVFPQFSHGAQLFETAQGDVIRDRGFASMQGAFRVHGGMGALVYALAAELPEESVLTGRSVRLVSDASELQFADGASLSFDRIVMALPSRVAGDLHYVPHLPPDTTAALQSIPTWMAGHAKLVALYESPFWRDDGLSGDASSQRGPLVEIHDASSDGSAALFGFLGVSAAARAGQRDAVISAALAQLARLFGPRGEAPQAVFYTDWAEETETAVSADHAPLTHHPAYGRPAALQEALSDRLYFASTELAPEMGGFLEGALAAADEAADWVMRSLSV
jgi:monoamine oxidase